MNYRLLKVAIIFFSLFLISCEESSDTEPSPFGTGVFFVNEGNFLDADGTISHYDPSTGVVTHDLFGKNNSERALGDVVQSMTIEGDRGYIVVNNSNKIEVVDIKTFKSIESIELSLPRYFTVKGNFGYATEWVSYDQPGRVAIIDLERLTIVHTVTVGFYPEHLFITNGKIFVANSGSNTISVIDEVSHEVIETLEAGNSPSFFALDTNNKLWVLCTGGYDENYNPLNNGKLDRVNPETLALEQSVNLSQNVGGRLMIDPSRSLLFYWSGGEIYKHSITATEATEPFILAPEGTFFYGLGIDPGSGEIFAGDATGFAANGSVFRYSDDGSLIEVIEAGRGPNSFVFHP